jgi:integrase
MLRVSRSKPERIEVKDGNIVVPIYKFSDGRFCVDTMLGEKRKRITRASLEKAKYEARKLIAKIASGRSDEPLNSPEIEEYRLAKAIAAKHGRTILSVMEEWELDRNRKSTLVPKEVPAVVEEFLAVKQLEGVSRLHFQDRQSRLRKFAAAFKGRIDRITSTEIEIWLRDLGGHRRTIRNYRNALLQLFRFARLKRYLPKGEAVVIEDIVVARPASADGEIQIYSPEELELLLADAPDALLKFIAIGAFAGLRSEEIMRLEWKDIQFSRGFIEVTAAKAKTASRRLVPLLPVLKNWIWPLRKDTGRVLDYSHNSALIRARIAFCKTGIVVDNQTVEFTWKPNALRHSFASYRLAEVKDAARVALEMGNSPTMLFRNYRELVTEQQAQEWFVLNRAAVRPKEVPFTAQVSAA